VDIDAGVWLLAIHERVLEFGKLGWLTARTEHLHPTGIGAVLGHYLRSVSEDDMLTGAVELGVDRLVRAFPLIDQFVCPRLSAIGSGEPDHACIPVIGRGPAAFIHLAGKQTDLFGLGIVPSAQGVREVEGALDRVLDPLDAGCRAHAVFKPRQAAVRILIFHQNDVQASILINIDDDRAAHFSKARSNGMGGPRLAGERTFAWR
jgi:hypothetical protein